MSNVQINVTHPTQREDGSSATVADVKSWRLETQADGAVGWTPIGGTNTPDVTARTINNVTPGTWNYRAFWTDQYDQESQPAGVQVTVPLPSPLAPGTITATITP